MSAPLKLALVGAGGIGHAYAEASKHVEEVELAYVADVRPDGAKGLAEARGAEYVADPLSLADPERVGLALLCTPPSTHEELAVAFLEAGVPVMCEKPLATSRAAGQRILAAAAQSGTPLTMASKFRFVEDVIEARSMVRSGMIGDVLSAEVAFCAPVDMRSRWNSQPEISGGGVLMDNGTHGVDILRYVVGPLESVSAILSSSTPDLEVEDSALLLARLDGGVLGSVQVSWASDRLTQRYLAVMGTEGTLEVNWKGSRVRQRSSSADVPFGEGYDKFQALGGNLRNTARALQGTEEMRVSTLDAMASVLAIEAAYESSRAGAWVAVSSAAQERLAG
jgi:predicted dehydrogenase